MSRRRTIAAVEPSNAAASDGIAPYSRTGARGWATWGLAPGTRSASATTSATDRPPALPAPAARP